MTSPREQSDNRAFIVAFLSIVILALSLRLLVITENSLEEGRGLPESALTTTIPMLVVILAIIAIMLRDGKGDLLALHSVNPRIAALMAAMFLLGLVIEPSLPRPSVPPGGDAIGLLLLLVPVFLIATMLRPILSVSVDEEE